MPILDQAAKLATRKMPKVITPKAHAVIDYAIAASFFAIASSLWRRNRRAAVGALLCGAAKTVTSLCTDYPGGVVNKISLRTHGNIDLGLSTAVASLPDVLHFGSEPESNLFRLQGIALATVTGLTDFASSGEAYRSEDLGERSA